MRPSSSLIYEPGAEQGVPQGCDLFTFVTSAASHMMRTLQRPRKSRPSKRQVNHRRFLHNMIHRKFAEIKAANRQLSSAIFSREEESTQDSSPIYVSTDQSDDAAREESSAGKLLPTHSSVSTSLSLSLFSPDNTAPSNQEEEPNSLWTFNLHLESPRETMDLPYGQAFSTEMHDTSTEASRQTFRLSSAAEEEGSKLRSFDTYDSHPWANLQFEPVEIDIRDENASSLVEKCKKCEGIRSSPESDPNQQYNAGPLTPDIHAPNFNPTPTPAPEPQSLSTCAFEIQTAVNSHCSLTDVNAILENPEADTTDSFYLTDSGTRVGEECRGSLSQTEPAWAPPSRGVNSEIQFVGAFLNADFEMSHHDADDLVRCRKAGAKRNAGVSSFNGTNRFDPDYLPASFPHFDALDKPRMNDGGESGDAVRDLGIRDSWPSEPTSISKTKTPVLSSGAEGNDTFCKNYMAGYDSCSITGTDLLGLAYGRQGDSQSTLGGGEWQKFRSEVQGIPPSACLNSPSVLDAGLDQSSISSGGHPMPPIPTSFPNSCSPSSSCMRGGGYQNHTPFMDVAKFQSQKPHVCRILTPPLEDYWLFDNILGEHETREI